MQNPTPTTSLTQLETELSELRLWLDNHPTDFKKHLKLKQLSKTYGIALNKQQEDELRSLGY